MMTNFRFPLFVKPEGVASCNLKNWIFVFGRQAFIVSLWNVSLLQSTSSNFGLTLTR